MSRDVERSWCTLLQRRMQPASPLRTPHSTGGISSYCGPANLETGSVRGWALCEDTGWVYVPPKGIRLYGGMWAGKPVGGKEEAARLRAAGRAVPGSRVWSAPRDHGAGSLSGPPRATAGLFYLLHLPHHHTSSFPPRRSRTRAPECRCAQVPPSYGSWFPVCVERLFTDCCC